MDPLPQNNTARLFLDYSAEGFNHTMMLRLPAPAVGDAGVYATTYANIFAQRMFTSFSFYAARFSAEGSDFSLPIPFTPVPGVIPLSSPFFTEDPQSVFLSFVGRDITAGRRWHVEFFTSVATANWPGDNRYNPGDAAPIDTLRTNFAAAASSGGTRPLASISGNLLTIYGYVNIAHNAYFQRKQRG